MNLDLSDANYKEILGALLGVFCVVYGSGFRWRYRKLLRDGIRVEGEVIELKVKSRNRRSSYYPVIRYVTNNGPVVEKYDVISSNPSIYKQWELVPVVYDPVDNKNFILENTSSKTAGPLLMFIGFIVIIIAVAFYIFDPQSLIRF